MGVCFLLWLSGTISILIAWHFADRRYDITAQTWLVNRGRTDPLKWVDNYMSQTHFIKTKRFPRQNKNGDSLYSYRAFVDANDGLVEVIQEWDSKGYGSKEKILNPCVN